MINVLIVEAKKFMLVNGGMIMVGGEIYIVVVIARKTGWDD